MKNYVDVEVSDDNTFDNSKKFEHPAFATVSVTNVNGRKNLFMSEFEHMNYVSFEVNLAHMKRNLSNNFVYSDTSLIRFSMSEAQFARLITRMNRGDSPCTLERFNGESVPQIPSPLNTKQLFKEEVPEKIKEAVKKLDKIENIVNDSNLSKKLKEEIIKNVASSRRSITNSIDFVKEEFVEHMERVTLAAKSEVDAYCNINNINFNAITKE